MNVTELLLRPNLNKIEHLMKPMHRIPEYILSPFNPDFERPIRLGRAAHERLQEMMQLMRQRKRGMEESDRGKDNSIERPAKRNKL